MPVSSMRREYPCMRRSVFMSMKKERFAQTTLLSSDGSESCNCTTRWRKPDVEFRAEKRTEKPRCHSFNCTDDTSALVQFMVFVLGSASAHGFERSGTPGAMGTVLSRLK